MHHQNGNENGGAPTPHAVRAPNGAPAALAAPSLDTKCQNPTANRRGMALDVEGLEKEKKKKENEENENPTTKPKSTWDRKQKRAYHKAITLFKYWHAAAYQVFFVT